MLQFADQRSHLDSWVVFAANSGKRSTGGAMLSPGEAVLRNPSATWRRVPCEQQVGILGAGTGKQGSSARVRDRARSH